MSFEHMVKTFYIPKTNLYRYVQVQSLVKNYFNTRSTLPPYSWIEDIFDLSVSDWGLISTVYSLIQRVASPSLDFLKKQWEEDFGSVVPETVWQSAVEPSICVRHGLLQFKIIHRLHFSRSKLARIFPEIDPTCSRCHNTLNTLTLACFIHSRSQRVHSHRKSKTDSYEK